MGMFVVVIYGYFNGYCVCQSTELSRFVEIGLYALTPTDITMRSLFCPVKLEMGKAAVLVAATTKGTKFWG